MNPSIKQKLPLMFFIGISIWWAYYYQTHSPLNDFGQANFEWLYLLDGLLVLPILCFLCIKDKKEALIKAIVYACILVLIGSYIIPEQNKFFWRYLETGRYIVLGTFLIVEITALLTVYLAIRSSLQKTKDPDLAIAEPVYNFLGKTPIANFLIFEVRIWTYALFARNVRPENFKGKYQFNYHLKDDAQSNAIGFILLIAAEMPIMHLIIHFLWSPLAANVITLLTLFSLLFFIAEYRAMGIRPITIDESSLNIRFGIYNNRVIPLSNIKSISSTKSYIKRDRSIKRYNFSGNPNVLIQLKITDKAIDRIYLGVNNPNDFIKIANKYIS
ncbi:PH domain-containing protein [Kangiella sp. TOML190]|uniref:PH domain-containing protein n=1 Tax=Kangiella sp. TOML190 TaxID=2931351 RepID=UPI00203BED16|nr:PH domain-containing protein [Kangiella sp. TOML190]